MLTCCSMVLSFCARLNLLSAGASTQNTCSAICAARSGCKTCWLDPEPVLRHSCLNVTPIAPRACLVTAFKQIVVTATQTHSTHRLPEPTVTAEFI